MVDGRWKNNVKGKKYMNQNPPKTLGIFIVKTKSDVFGDSSTLRRLSMEGGEGEGIDLIDSSPPPLF